MTRPGPDGPVSAPMPAERETGAAPDPAASGADIKTLETLKKRAEFLACARARRAHAAGLILQGRRRAHGEVPDGGIRVGYTCSKKVGKAVQRNRAKRRLREAARAVLPRLGHAGWDYVLIGRAEITASRPFAALTADLETALGKLHRPGR